MTPPRPKKCRRKATKALPSVCDMTLHNTIQELFEGLEVEVMKRIPLIYTFDNIERFQSMLCNYCCDERRPKFSYLYDDDCLKFVEDHWLNRSERAVDKETIDRAIRIASLYMALCILVKEKARKHQDYEP
jgi:hypothetical protein